MDVDLKRKALARLAESNSAAAETALLSEIEKIEATLRTSTQYDTLENQLDVLGAFGYRLCDRIAEMVLSFIQRLGKFEVTYSDEQNMSGEEIKTYQNANTLTNSAIGVLVELRYLEPAKILPALLELTLHDSKSVRDKAVEGLEVLGNYEITVFFGSDEQKGIGPTIQKLIIDQLGALEDSDLLNYSSAIVTLSRCLLSPTMEATSGTYNTFTWTKAAVPAVPGVVEVRQGAISLLKRMYTLADSVPTKLGVLSALGEATHTHHAGDFHDDVRDMIAGNTVDVLGFFEALIETEDLPIVQKIEQKSYWRYYHALSKQVEIAAHAVEGAISKHAEYQIYKDLIGYEGIFGDWSELKASESRWDGVDEYRKGQASKYASNITQENYNEWRQRIFEYAKTESNDLATFPNFFQFLREFAEKRPGLALDLITNDHEQIRDFLIPLFRGLWGSGDNGNFRQLVDSWIGQNRYLMQCTKMFLENDDLDLHTLTSILIKAEEVGDRDVLRMIVSVAISNYSSGKEHLIRRFFVPAIRSLTAYGDAQWVLDSWFRRELKLLIQSMDQSETDLILENLLLLDEIDYHAEEILSRVAQRDPARVLEFLGQRLLVEAEGRKRGSRTFDAIPYALHKLNESLSVDPGAVVRTVRGWYDGDYGMFIYGAAKLLQIIFPEFPEKFEAALIECAKSAGKDDLEFVLAVLRNYEGIPRIHAVCKEIIRSVSEGDEILSEVRVALSGTGVVSGEFGFSEAYVRKAAEVADWTNDPDTRIRVFAEKYIEGLTKASAAERVRAEEEIELRKYRYGE